MYGTVVKTGLRCQTQVQSEYGVCEALQLAFGLRLLKGVEPIYGVTMEECLVQETVRRCRTYVWSDYEVFGVGLFWTDEALQIALPVSARSFHFFCVSFSGGKKSREIAKFLKFLIGGF